MNTETVENVFEDMLEAYNVLDNAVLQSIQEDDKRKLRLSQRTHMMKEWRSRFDEALKTRDIVSGVDSAAAGVKSFTAMMQIEYKDGTWSIRDASKLPAITAEEAKDRWHAAFGHPTREQIEQVLSQLMAEPGELIEFKDKNPTAPASEPEAAPEPEPAKETKTRSKKNAEPDKPVSTMLDSLPYGHLCVATVSIKSTPAKKKEWTLELEKMCGGLGAVGGVGKSGGGVIGIQFFFDSLEKSHQFHAALEAAAPEYLRGYSETILDEPRHEIDKPWFSRMEKWVENLAARQDRDTLQEAFPGVGADFNIQLHQLSRTVLYAAFQKFVDKPATEGSVVDLLLVLDTEEQLLEERLAWLNASLGLEPRLVEPSPADADCVGMDVYYPFQSEQEAESGYEVVKLAKFIRGYGVLSAT